MECLLFLLLVPGTLLFLFAALSLIVRPRPVDIPIKRRHVLVSGGSSGIGLAIASQAASEGARVSILARDRKNLEKAREEIKLATGVEATVLSCDVRDAAAVASAVEEAGPVDVLVCSHGACIPGVLETQELEEVKTMVDVNIMGTFNLVKAVLPAMKRRTKETGTPSSVAIVCSQAGQVGIYAYTGYSASKFGVRGLAEALQHEVFADNIRVSLIYPLETDTPGLVDVKKRRPEVLTLIAGSSGHMMKPEDVAKVSWKGIKSGTFNVPCNFLGGMLSMGTAGLSPQHSASAALAEVFFASLMRFLALCFQWNWYSIIEKYHAKQIKQ